MAKIVKDTAPLANAFLTELKGARSSRVTFFPSEGWRDRPKDQPVDGNIVVELLGVNVNDAEVDAMYTRKIQLPVGHAPCIVGAEKLAWTAKPTDDAKYAKCLTELDSEGRIQFAGGRISFVGDDDERGLILALPLGGHEAVLGDVRLAPQLDQETGLPVFSQFTDRNGEVVERPVMWAHPRVVTVRSTDAEFGSAPVRIAPQAPRVAPRPSTRSVKAPAPTFAGEAF